MVQKKEHLEGAEDLAQGPVANMWEAEMSLLLRIPREMDNAEARRPHVGSSLKCLCDCGIYNRQQAPGVNLAQLGGGKSQLRSCFHETGLWACQ